MIELKLVSKMPFSSTQLVCHYNKECPAETFIHSDKPTELLGQYHTFLMDASVSRLPLSLFSPIYRHDPLHETRIPPAPVDHTDPRRPVSK